MTTQHILVAAEAFSAALNLAVWLSATAWAGWSLFSKEDELLMASPSFKRKTWDSIVAWAKVGTIPAVIAIGIAAYAAVHGHRSLLHASTAALLIVLIGMCSVAAALLSAFVIAMLVGVLLQKLHLLRGIASFRLALAVVSIIVLGIFGFTFRYVAGLESAHASLATIAVSFSILPSHLFALALFSAPTALPAAALLLLVAAVICAAMIAIYGYATVWYLQLWQDIMES